MTIAIGLTQTVHADPVKKDLPACISEDALDELTTYAAKQDDAGTGQLLRAGKCTMLHRGDSVSVIDPGFLVATIRVKGVKMFTPSEAVR